MGQDHRGTAKNGFCTAKPSVDDLKRALLSKYIQNGNREGIYALADDPLFTNPERCLALACIDYNEEKYTDATRKIACFVDGKDVIRPPRELLALFRELLALYCVCQDKTKDHASKGRHFKILIDPKSTPYESLLILAKAAKAQASQPTSSAYAQPDTVGRGTVGTGRCRTVLCPIRN